MVPPHDVPLAKKLIVDNAACRRQVCGSMASKRTSSGMRIESAVAPEWIARAPASTNVATLVRRLIAAIAIRLQQRRGLQRIGLQTGPRRLVVE